MAKLIAQAAEQQRDPISNIGRRARRGGLPTRQSSRQREQQHAKAGSNTDDSVQFDQPIFSEEENLEEESRSFSLAMQPHVEHNGLTQARIQHECKLGSMVHVKATSSPMQ